MKKLISGLIGPSEELTYPSVLTQAYLEYNSYQIPVRGAPIVIANPDEISDEFVSSRDSEELSRIYHGFSISKGVWLAFGIHSGIFCGLLGIAALGIG